MTAEPQDVQAPARAPRHLERRRYQRTPGEQLDYVREAVPHHPDEVEAGRSRAPVYNPGGLSATQYASSSRRSGSSQSVVTSRRRRSGAGRLVALGVVAVLGVVGWQAYPAVHAQAVAWAHDRVAHDLDDVAAAQAQHRQLNGGYTLDLTALVLPSGVDDVQVVSAGRDTFCLRGAPVVGPQVWFTPAGGRSGTPCA